MSDLTPAVQAWIQKAENDLKTIRASLASADPTWDTVCFHAQQAAEKYLKAYLVYQGDLPPRTHDLGRLLGLCEDFDASLASLEQDSESLSDYAVETRYPDIFEPDELSARSAIAAAEHIVQAIKSRLRSDGPTA